MLIINADDWGGWRKATDAAFACHERGRITSATAMVFMEDSERGAELAKSCGLQTGLHINLNQPFTGKGISARVGERHGRVAAFLRSSRYAQLLYNPFLSKDFKYVFEAQVEEFTRLYSRAPSHFDGHQHMHLCATMLVSKPIPRGKKVRRTFSFARGEKSVVNRMYRRCVDKWVKRRYVTTDYFFSLSQNLRAERIQRVLGLAEQGNVELMTHPEVTPEYEFLMKDKTEALLKRLELGSYADLRSHESGAVAETVCA